jgi:chemotaxis response regulator CheB
MPEPAEPFLVVGLGASAGGISVLKEFFRHVPKTTGDVPSRRWIRCSQSGDTA